MAKKKSIRRRRKNYKITTFTSRRKGMKGRRMVRLKTRFGSAALRRNPVSGNSIISLFKNVVSKENLQIAGGIIGASVLNKAVIGKFGDKLPMSSTPLGNTLYQAAIPALTAVAVRRFAPKVAEGLVLGGLVVAVNNLLKQYLPQAAGFASYIDSVAPYPTIPFPTSGELTPTTGSVDSASRMNASVSGYSGIYDSPMPFAENAWAN
jgi:hypothetical protein